MTPPDPAANGATHLPPSDIPAEMAVLGGIMANAHAYNQAARIITAGDWWRPAHDTIWRALTDLAHNGHPTDPIAVKNHLEHTGDLAAAGGPTQLATIYQRGAPTNVDYYAGIVHDKGDLRRVETIGIRLAQLAATDPDPATLITRARALLDTAPAAATDDGPDARYVTAGRFLFDTPATIPALWGHHDEVLWARGEALLIAGPAGTGKTTLAQQLVLGLIGLRTHVLGYPLQQATRVLYLASDRPSQARKSLLRMVTPADRDTLEHRLTIWRGPPPADIAKNTALLVDMADQAQADVLVLDSLKDMALGLSDDEVGAGLNQAIQRALAADLEILGLHHPRKAPQGPRHEPTNLDELYGSTWITAGAGSVISLHGNAGDPVVQFRHLKQPGAEIGPYTLAHDHDTGTTTIHHGTDLIETVRASMGHGLTVRAAASALFPSAAEPTDSEIAKARRRLDKLTRDGHLVRIADNAAAPISKTNPARWHLAAHPDQ